VQALERVHTTRARSYDEMLSEFGDEEVDFTVEATTST
jgi:hypothetical protein